MEYIFTLCYFRLFLEKATSHHVEDNASTQLTLQEYLSAGVDRLRLGRSTVGHSFFFKVNNFILYSRDNHQLIYDFVCHETQLVVGKEIVPLYAMELLVRRAS